MSNQLSINDILESISKFPLEEQSMLSEIIRKRVIEARRSELAKSIKESRNEYEKGLSGHGSVSDFLKEIENE